MTSSKRSETARISAKRAKTCFRRTPLALGVAMLAGFSSGLALAQPGLAVRPIEEVVVFGRATDLVGVAETASQGSISGADLLIRPLVKTAELLESMPGMVAVQHSGTGKANQYFLRGFNLDHGTDYTTLVDGVPLNFRSHGHGQGYLDVNGIIPETVERVDYRKGPYRADIGDFSLAGVSHIRTIDRVERSFVSAEAGRFGWQRYVAGMTQDLNSGPLSLLAEFKRYDGPWEKGEDLNHLSLWSKYLTSTQFGQLAVTLSGLETSWDPTEQIPERAIGTAVCADAFCALDPSATGETSRWIMNFKLMGPDWDINAWTQYYDWQMSSNPTYDFQFNQFDRRWTFGLSGDKSLVDNNDYLVRAGADYQYDVIGKVGIDEFDNGMYVDDFINNRIKEGSVGAWVEGTWYATEDLRLFAGLRADYYDFRVRALTDGSFAGSESDSMVTPKLGAAYTLTEAVELYANWGRGFHSNDARGVVNAADPVPGLSRGTGYEAGSRVSVGDLRFTAVYWWLDQDSELIFEGEENSVEPRGSSERQGLELAMFWQPLNWLGVDASWNRSQAYWVDNPDGRYVDGAVEKAAQVGLTVTRSHWDASLRLRYLGPYALLEDNSQRASSLTTVNLRVARHWDDLSVFVEAINLSNTRGKEIVYYYPAYVEGLDPAGLSADDIDCDTVNCRMSRVTEPRSFRIGLSYRF